MALWYVDPISGSDTTGTGSEALPYKTMAKARTSAANWDTIVLEGGLYRETITVSNKPLTYYGRGLVVVDGEGIRLCVDGDQTAGAVTGSLYNGYRYWNSPHLFVNIIFRNGKSASTAKNTIMETQFSKTGLGNAHISSANSSTPQLQAFINCSFYFDTSSSANSIVSVYTDAGGSANAGTGTQSFQPNFKFYHCTFTSIDQVIDVTQASTLISVAVPIGPGTSVAALVVSSSPPGGPQVGNTYVGSQTSSSPAQMPGFQAAPLLTLRDCIVNTISVSVPSAYQNKLITDTYSTSTPVSGTESTATGSVKYSGTATSGGYVYTVHFTSSSNVTYKAPYNPVTTGSLNAARGATDSTHDVNISSTAVPFASAVFPNPDLSLNYAGAGIASYLGTGTAGSNKGSAWFPVFGYTSDWLASTTGLPTNLFVGNNAWTDPLDQTQVWITDPNYPDGVNKGPAIRINDANGDHWEVDTVSAPSSTSAAVVSPVMKVVVRAGGSSKVRRIIREALEDLTGASGAKKVVDSTIGTTTRTAQWRAQTASFTQTNAVLAWNDLSFTADLTSTTFTATYYIQYRLILTTVGA